MMVSQEKSRKRRGSQSGLPNHQANRTKFGNSTIDAENHILLISLDLFSERGFASVTIKDLAKASGLAPALIYYYFGSKEELYRRAVALAVDRAFGEFRTVVHNLERPRDIIYGWIDNHIRVFETIAKLFAIAIDYSKVAKRNKRIDEAVRRFYDEEREVLCGALTAGIESGEFREVDIWETATFISTYLDGVFVRAIILADFDPIAAIGELRIFMQALLMRGRTSTSEAIKTQ